MQVRNPTLNSTPSGSHNALSNPNLRLYLSGQVVSMVGTWMQQMALSWLIYRLTNSEFMLGAIGFASQAPAFFLTPVAGIVADRVNRHKLVITTQTLAMIQAGLLAAVVLSGHTQIWHLLVLGAFMGVINAFDMPGRQTFLVDMLRSPEELPNAIAVNSSIVTLTRLAGPAIAGFCIAWFGEGICFLINAVSFVAVIIALLFIKPNVVRRPASGKHPLAEMKEGFAYAFGFGPIRALILLLALVSMFGMPYAVLMPAFAKNVFGGNATTLGWLTSAAGVGSLIGAVYLASRKGVLGLGRWILISSLLFGAGLVGFGFSHWLVPSLLLLVLVGFGGMVQMAATNTLLQTIVEEDKRGRVMSLFTMSFIGLAPFGSMVAGMLADKIGTGPTVIGSGIICLLLGAAFGANFQQLRREVRPIYIERGILQAENEMNVLNR
ncbi:MAG TPA: MFS transporter [Candidatus Obscuribacterales bacterium]